MSSIIGSTPDANGTGSRCSGPATGRHLSVTTFGARHLQIAV